SLDNAPTGGNLEVQIAALITNPTTSSATTGAAAPNWALPIVIDVQRQDVTVPASITTASDPGKAAIGTLPFISLNVPGVSAFPGPVSPVLPKESGAPPLVAGQSLVIPTQDEPPVSNSEPSEGFNIRVVTGPLASRSAAPLGPSLATVLFDLAPPVDR